MKAKVEQASGPITQDPRLADGAGGNRAHDADHLPKKSEYTMRSWKVLIGALCLTIPSYGLTSAIGLFQTYWQEHQLADVSATDISWILSIYGFLSCFIDIIVGVLFDRYPLNYFLPLGCLAYAAAFLGLGWASTYGELLGCFVVAGTFTAFPGVVAFGVVDQWFKSDHSFAIGFVTVGAPLGGIFFSLTLQALFDRFQWKIAMVILASILAGFLSLGVLLLEPHPESRRLDPGGSCPRPDPYTSSEATGSLTQASPSISTDSRNSSQTETSWMFLRSRKFYLFSYTVFVFEFILYAQWGSLPSYAVFVGLGNEFYIQTTYNIGAIFARTVPTYLATRWGPFNVSLLMVSFTVTVFLALWLPAGDQSIVALYIVVFLIGLGTGSYTPLAASCISELCDGRGYGKWIGACYSLSSFALLISNPLTQVILESKGPRVLIAVLGAVLFTAFCTCLGARWLKVDKTWHWREKV